MASRSLILVLVISLYYVSDAFTFSQTKILRNKELSMKSDNIFRPFASAIIVASSLSIGQLAPQTAFADGVFFERKTYSEVVNPKDAQLVDDAAANENVKSGKAAIKKYIAAVTSLENDLKKDAQLDVRQRLAADLNPGLVKIFISFLYLKI